MSKSGIGVWFRDELADMLDAIDGANLDIARRIPTPEMKLYRAGFDAAMKAIRQSLGVNDGRI